MSQRSNVWRRSLAPMLCVALAACDEAAEPPPETAIVVGITADFIPGPDVGRLLAKVHVDGAELPARTWAVSGAEPLAFPTELWISDLTGGEEVDVSLSAYEGVGPNEEPFYTRDAATSSVAGSTLLLRTHLEWECVPSFQLPGEEKLAPRCDPPETCIAATCEDPHVPPESLSPYEPSWAVDYVDECRPEGAGEPEVVIGQGIDEFEPLAPGGSMVMYSGSQGGFHVWVALRAHDLHREGSTTSVEIHRADTGEELCTAKIPWDFHPSGDGACDLAGIQCVVSFDVKGASLLNGEAAIISAKVVDLLGNVGFGEQEVTLGTLK